MKKCKAQLIEPTGWGGKNPCHNNARQGSEWCGIHDPEAKAARAAKRGPAKWEMRLGQLEKAQAAIEVVEELTRAPCAVCGEGNIHVFIHTDNCPLKAYDDAYPT